MKIERLKYHHLKAMSEIMLSSTPISKIGKPYLIVDTIMNEVMGAHIETDNDSRGFLELFNLIDKGHADL